MDLNIPGVGTVEFNPQDNPWGSFPVRFGQVIIPHANILTLPTVPFQLVPFIPFVQYLFIQGHIVLRFPNGNTLANIGARCSIYFMDNNNNGFSCPFNPDGANDKTMMLMPAFSFPTSPDQTDLNVGNVGGAYHGADVDSNEKLAGSGLYLQAFNYDGNDDSVGNFTGGNAADKFLVSFVYALVPCQSAL